MQYGEKALEKMYDRSTNEYNEAQKKYDEAVKDGADKKTVQELKNKRDDALVNATGNFLFKYIGGSSLKDALDALVHRSNAIEREFGYLDKETIKEGDYAQKFQYLMEFIGRSHSAIKTFSGRASFASGFMARIEAAVKNGEDVSNPDRILEIANESYLDWDRGKYQQSNFVSDAWGHITNNLEKEYKGTKWEKLAKGTSAFFKLDVPITRVPVNILHESVMEYTLGAFRALTQTAKVYGEARKEAKSEGLVTGTPEFKKEVQDYISKMDKEQLATIVRCFRKGGFGLGLFAVMALGGVMQYGGFHHRNEKKKRRGKELLPGEIQVLGEDVPKIAGKIIEHTPGLYPALLGLNTAHTYNEKIAKKETSPQAAIDAIIGDLENIQDQIPQAKVINPIGIGRDVIKSTGRQFGLSTPKK